MHHRHKIDAPSGTALALGRAAAAGRKVQLEDVWRKSRDGHTGARPTGEIGFATLRGGEEVGVHTVYFAAAGERLELNHRSFSRETYAAGAVTSAKWLEGKKPGLYGMKDVLGL
jgi:4-hydroxy-tetrahydrodipicolinate reductase